MAPGKRAPPLPECSSSDILEFGIEVQASTVPRKHRRGPSRGLTVKKLYEKLGHKIPVEFDATSRRSKGKYNGEFIGYIGIAVRTRLPHQAYRGELSAWFQQHGGDPEGRLTPFPDVDESDWKWLCDNIFATKNFQD
ncbi:hypothetical protein H6P81_013581 [Aristolochia fimbriata]|uniref:Uncharacterized protein n=1 Tax=Aristolochia fimbriata TaxID=158543 RepID=A0AAV7EJR2_ARIFI|nr:hypothetical protein H6P81_013581 [Aristolochia fimbriata]